MRLLGNVISDLESLAEELFMEHDLQLGDVDALIEGYTKKHYPGFIEEYEDGTNPVKLYGHIDNVIEWAKNLERLRGIK